MTIIITVNTTWNIYNFRLELLKKLQKNGHSIIALAPPDKYVEKLEEIEIKFYPIQINAKGINPLEDLKLIRNYYSILKKIKPDVVLSYTIKPNIYATIACRFLKIPTINNVSGLGTLFIKKSVSSYIARMLYRIAFKKSFWIFFQNKHDQNEFERLKLIPNGKSSVLPGSGVNLNKFSFERNMNKGKRFLFVGRLLGDKGIRVFIKAAIELSKEDSSLTFLMAGESGYNNRTSISNKELDEWLKNDQIKYLGKKDNMIAVFADCDVMVLPSYREGLSKSLIEAAAMNLPIITTNVPGCREVVEEGKNGYLCQEKNVDNLYRIMKKMTLLSEEERIKMGKYSRQKAEKEFDERIVINSYFEIIACLA
jgi:glycosyltransferase involved in cell wall biosynthesis